MLRDELGHLRGIKDKFVAAWGEEGFNTSVDNWETKIVRSTEGEQVRLPQPVPDCPPDATQRWGLYTASKPE